MHTRTVHKSKLHSLAQRRAPIRATRNSSLRKLTTAARQPLPVERERQFDYALGLDTEFKEVFGSNKQADIAEYFDRFI